MKGLTLKKLILILSLVFGFVYADEEETIARYVSQLGKLNSSQMTIMLKSYVIGSEYDLGYALAAVAWKESNFGMYMMNLSDGKYGSFGAFHINLEYAVIRNKITSSWAISRYAERLINDFELSASEAISELMFWKKYNAKKLKRYRLMFTMYNGGSKGDLIESSKKYGEDMILRVKALRIYFDNNKVIDSLIEKGYLK